MIRPALGLTLAAAAAACTVAGLTAVTAGVARGSVTQIVGWALVMYLFTLAIGSSWWLGASSIPLLGAALIDAGFGQDPVWLRSIVIGCGWFAVVELGWEAIERRAGGQYRPAASVRRVQEVTTVIVVAAGLGVTAVTVAALAPARSVMLQAAVVVGLLAALASLIRALLAEPASGRTG